MDSKDLTGKRQSSLNNFLFIVNPVAQRGNSLKEWNLVEGYLKANNIQYKVLISKKPGDCVLLSGEYNTGVFDVIVSVGGDGTIHEVVNGLKDNLENVTLGILPVGTGNDFAKSLGIPINTLDALEIILCGNTKKIDLGKVNGKLFVNVGGVGFDAEVCNEANNKMKKISGTSAYIVSVLKTLFDYSPAQITLEVDGQIYNDKMWMVSVANGKYFGNGMKIAPDAQLDDGLFDIISIKETSILYFLKVFPGVFSGSHINDPCVKIHRGKKITITSEIPFTVQCDGEILGNTPITFEIIEKGINVCCPLPSV